MGLLQEIAGLVRVAAASKIDERLVPLREAIEKLTKEIKIMGDAIAGLEGEIAQLTAQVAASVSVEGAALLLIQGFNAQLAAAIAPLAAVGADTSKLDALRSQLMNSADALSSAVAANTAVTVVPPVAANTAPAEVPVPTAVQEAPTT